MVYIFSAIFCFLLCFNCFSTVLCCMATPNKSSTSATTAVTKKAGGTTKVGATTKVATTTKKAATTTAATTKATTTKAGVCSNTNCDNACKNRGCQTGTCNKCTTAADTNETPCNTVYADGRCTCNFCTKTPCAQPDQLTGTFFEIPNCKSIGCDSGDCFEGITLCVGCAATNTTVAATPVTTSAIATCTPSACATFCEQKGCATGGCDLFYKNQPPNPCSCSTCIDPDVICTRAACHAKCVGFGCDHGSCDQGICGCFKCPSG